jgi:hypothetical protein
MEESQGCSKCKKKSLFKTVTPMLFFGFYILASAIYGNYVLIKLLINFFK